MDNQPSMSAESQQYPQLYQHYQQPQPESTNPNPYDPSTQSQAYYASYQHYNQTPNQQPQPQPQVQPDYSSYYYPDYSTPYQSQPLPDPSSVYPPGVTISADPRQTLVQSHPDVYYTHALSNPQQQQSQNVYTPQPSHSAFPARGGHGGRPVRGGGRGGRGRRGSSRGRGRGGGQAAAGIPRQMPHLSSSGPGQAALVAPKKASCEICKVDCTTPEILEQHKNGKKHKRNLKVYEEMLTLSKVQVVTQTPHTQGLYSKLEAVQPEKKEGGSVVICEVVSNNNIGRVDTAVCSAVEANSSGIQMLGKREHMGSARGGLKRKMKGGRGVKLMRSSDGSRRRVEPAKPKQVPILFCELCNVKCESRVVWDSHIAGKKHLSNAKQFPGHQAGMGRGLQALYPRMPDVPSTQLTTQADQRLPEAQALASTLVNQQGLQDPQASQAALTQLLSQHGIHDAQSLLNQLIPFLLTQALPNGAAPSTSAQLGGPVSGAPGNVAEPVKQDQLDSSTQVAPIPFSETNKKSETVGESVPKTVSNEGVADQSNTAKARSSKAENTSTVPANVAGREKAQVASDDDSCKQE